jgi:hypothetical protein
MMNPHKRSNGRRKGGAGSPPPGLSVSYLPITPILYTTSTITVAIDTHPQRAQRQKYKRTPAQQQQAAIKTPPTYGITTAVENPSPSA